MHGELVGKAAEDCGRLEGMFGDHIETGGQASRWERVDGRVGGQTAKRSSTCSRSPNSHDCILSMLSPQLDATPKQLVTAWHCLKRAVMCIGQLQPRYYEKGK